MDIDQHKDVTLMFYLLFHELNYINVLCLFVYCVEVITCITTVLKLSSAIWLYMLRKRGMIYIECYANIKL